MSMFTDRDGRHLRVRVDRREPFEFAVDVSHSDDEDSSRFGRTKQSFKDECDINNIMKKFERTGMLDHLNTYEGRYGDFTDVPTDYQEALHQVQRADEMFMSLPAKVRDRFGNDPQAFLDFVSDPRNAEEMVDMGLARPAVPMDDAPAGDSAGGVNGDGDGG